MSACGERTHSALGPATASASPLSPQPPARLPGPHRGPAVSGPRAGMTGIPGALGLAFRVPPGSRRRGCFLAAPSHSGCQVGTGRKCRQSCSVGLTQLRGSVTGKGLFAGCFLPCDCLPRVSLEFPPSGTHPVLAFYAEIPERQGTECPAARARCPRALPWPRHLLTAVPERQARRKQCWELSRWPLCLFQVHVQKAGVSHSFQHRILYLNFSLKDSLWTGLASLCRTEWSVFLKRNLIPCR